MATRTGELLARAIRTRIADRATNDRDLLRRYAEAGDQSAFEAVVYRHSAMVLAVCRRVLHSQADAEDVCQAVFLVLARKAGTLRWQRSVANWLYATARKVAGNARVSSSRRAKREAAAAVPESVRPTDRITGSELVAVLDEELYKLPPRYREPLVLCYLEGLTRDEAAGRLGVPDGTLKKQLERARRKLAAALTARGCSLGTVLLAVAATSQAGNPARLIASIVTAVGGSPSAAAAALAQGVVVNGVASKLKLLAVAVAGAGVLGFAAASGPTGGGGQPPERREVGRMDDPAAKARPGGTDGLARGRPVAIQVVDPDGKPVAGATIRRLDGGRSSPVNETVLGKTDAAGRLAAESAPSATFTAVADGIGVAWSGPDVRAPELTLRIARPHPVKGRLTDLQGKPVAGAKVTVEGVAAAAGDDLTGAYNAARVNPEFLAAAFARSLDGKATGAPADTTTGPDGRFELAGVGRNQVVRLRFHADGVESTGVTVFADPDFPKRAGQPTDAEKRRNTFNTRQHKPAVYGPEFTHAARPEHLLTGTVVDAATGRPVAGVTVRGTTVPAVEAAGWMDAWQDGAAAVTDKDGRFTLRGLPKAVVWDLPFLPKEPQRWVHVRADGAAYLDTVSAVPDTTDYAPAKVEVKLRTAVVVSGTVTNKATGKAVRGEVKWFPLRSNGALADGTDAEAELYSGRNSATRPGGVWERTDAGGRFRLRVPPGPGVILARTAGPDRATPFAPVNVRGEDRKHLSKPEAAEGERTRRVVPVVEQDDTFDTLRMQWPLRWENGYTLIDPPPGTGAVEVTVAFDPGTTKTLAPVDPDGQPLAGVTVVGYGPFAEAVPTFPVPTIPVGGLDPRGRPQQFYLLHRGRKLCAAATLRGDEPGPVAVALKPCGSVGGRVVDHAGKPVAGAVVSFQLADYHPDILLRQKLYGDSNTATTDADGRFRFDRLFPDLAFDLFVSLPGFRSGAGSRTGVVLKPGEAKDVGEVRLRDPKAAGDEP